MLDLIGALLLILLALDAVAWALVLGVAGVVSLVKRFVAFLTPYR